MNGYFDGSFFLRIHSGYIDRFSCEDDEMNQGNLRRLVADGLLTFMAIWGYAPLWSSDPVAGAETNSSKGQCLGVRETWESSATGWLAEGPWQVHRGQWGEIDQQDADGVGRKYRIASGQISQIKRPVELDSVDHIVLQGWFQDPGEPTSSTLGLAAKGLDRQATIVGIGTTGKSTYRIEFSSDPDGGSGMQELDTSVEIEAGWHFLRLDLVQDWDSPMRWQGKWTIWNTSQTESHQGSFSLTFASESIGWILLGGTGPSMGAHAWDDVATGSLKQIGPSPALPQTWTISAKASSQLAGWEANRVTDGDVQTVYSSNGHGDHAEATEWVAIDLGGIHTVDSLQLTPRQAGLGFPVDYQIESSSDGDQWTLIPGQVHHGQERPEGVVLHRFSESVRARAIRVRATRLGSDSLEPGGQHYLQLAGIEVPRLKLEMQPWTQPGELRDKSINSTGTFSAVRLEREDAPTARYLAEHPEYLANHPFDGVTIPILIDGDYTRSQGLVSQNQFALHEIGMTSLPIPWEAVADAVEDLRRVRWGHCTDNFLWYGVSNFPNMRSEDGDRAYPVDPDSSDHWKTVVGNAAIGARVAREAGLRGFLVDTEQYTKYPSGERPEFPWGLGDAKVWKERGREWIEAVQKEYPEIELQFFFSWGDEHRVWPHYQNLVPFMNGVLAGIRPPARIIHAFESTFWYGQAREVPPGTIQHYAGDREPYAMARHAIRNLWRNESDAPERYDAFVDVGMAAWMESDPWNLWPGQVSGYQGPTAILGRSSWPSMPWSNLAMTLAYSDKYVWTWCASTNYPATWESLNPFLASVANQTFNTGREAVDRLEEDFVRDPMASGWYFDFSFMEIGRRDRSEDAPPQMVISTDAVAYAWKEALRAILVRGHWTRGESGEIEGLAAAQRRRFVHPIQPLSRSDGFHLEIDFTVDQFAEDDANPILIGLFHSVAPTDGQSVCLRVGGARNVVLQLAGDGDGWELSWPIAEGLEVGRPYRLVVDYQAKSRRMVVGLCERASGLEIGHAEGVLTEASGTWVVDEAGVAQREQAYAATSARSYQFRLEGLRLHRDAANGR
ncbi:MAG: discoidin domain-containing protein [Pirellulaceae bacterium]